MTIEEGLVAHLLADGTVTGIVVDRVYPEVRPQDSALPAIVYTHISDDRDVDMDGPSDFVRVRMQVDCWHTSYGDVKTLAAAVRAALNGVGIASPNLLGAEPVQLVVLENEGDLSSIDGDSRERRVSQDWIITHLET